MDIALFSDLHAHPFEDCSHTLEGGINSRLVDCVEALKQIIQHCRDKGIKTVINAGDTFHVKGLLDTVAFNMVYREIEKAADLEFFMIPGNHDFGTEDGREHALEAFESLPHVRIFDKPSTYSLIFEARRHARFFFLPFIRDKAKLAEKLRLLKAEADPDGPGPNILIAHQYAAELFKRHTGKEGKCLSADEFASGFDAVMLGHQHAYDFINVTTDTKKVPVVSIGSPLQHNFGDRGSERGFIILNTETLKHRHVSLTIAPEFKAFEGAEAIIPETVEGHFVRVRVKGKEEAAKAKAALEEAGAADFVVEIIPDPKDTRIELDPSLDDEGVLTKYLTSEWGKAPEALDQAELLAMGLEYLRRGEASL